MRPLIAADPILRIPRPEITPWSNFAGGAAGACAMAVEASAAPTQSASKVIERCMAVSGSALGGGGRGEREHRRIDRLVEFGRLDVDLALLEREVDAVDLLVFAQVRRVDLFLSADAAVVDHADFQELVRIE